MRPGVALKQGWRLDAADAKTCACGHRMGGHRELEFGSPGYAACFFHCAECSCVLDLTKKRFTK